MLINDAGGRYPLSSKSSKSLISLKPLWQHHAEPNSVAAVPRRAAGAMRHARTSSRIAPATTTRHASRACSRTPRIMLCSTISRIRNRYPVPAQFPYIARHIVETKLVRCKTANSPYLTIRVSCKVTPACNSIDIIATTPTKMCAACTQRACIFALLTATSRIFPLRLRRKTKTIRIRIHRNTIAPIISSLSSRTSVIVVKIRRRAVQFKNRR